MKRVRQVSARIVICGALVSSLAGREAIAQAPDSAVVVLRDVTVIDGSGLPAKPGMTVVIQGERILALGPSADIAVPSGARLHDLSGKFVVPGLIDAHVHLAPLAADSRDRLTSELDRMLHGGIVAMRVMAGPVALHASVRRAALAHGIPSPDVEFATVIAGPHFMAADPRTRGRTDVLPGVAGAEDVPAVVQEAARSGAIAVKLYAELDAVTMQAAVAESRRLGLHVWAHATVFPDRPLATVRAGVDGVSHACSLAWQDPDVDPARFPQLSADNRPTFAPTLVDANGAEMKALFHEMVRRHVVFDPTLHVQSLPRNARYGCDARLLTALTQAAHDAGVIIAAGTDFHADTADLFPALHQEIELLVFSGILTPLEGITAATQNGARALGREKTEGTVAPGMVANLVVLDRDPSTDIRNLRSVASVMKRGRMYRRADYLARRNATVSPASTAAPALACEAPLEPYVRADLYMDRPTRNLAPGRTSDEEWRAFVEHVLVPHFPSGGTVFENSGWWRRPNGTTFHGLGRTLVMLSPASQLAEHRAGVRAVIAEFKRRYGAQSVGWEESWSCVNF